jgi:hypothetical protein
LRRHDLVDTGVLVENPDQAPRQPWPPCRRGQHEEAAHTDRDPEPIAALDHHRDSFGERRSAPGHVAALQPGDPEQLQGTGAERGEPQLPAPRDALGEAGARGVEVPGELRGEAAEHQCRGNAVGVPRPREDDESLRDVTAALLEARPSQPGTTAVEQRRPLAGAVSSASRTETA